MNHHHHHHHPSPRRVVMHRWPRNSFFAMVAAVTLVILYFLATTTTTTKQSSASSTSQQQQQQQQLQHSSSFVVEQQVAHTMDGDGKNSIPISYYHCEPTPASSSSKSNAKQQQQQLILLHGSRFTKEDWKTSGILQDLCTQQGFSVTALDLSVKSSYADLVQVLQQLAALETLLLPVQGIVTPSASGKAIIEGLMHNSKNNQATPSLKDLTERWIPVACLGLLQMQKSSSFQNNNNNNDAPFVLPPSWPILAIHGDQDGPGKQSSELLLSWSSTSASASSGSQNGSSSSSSQQAAVSIQELPGRHPCYLDSPVAFVQAVTAFLKG